MNAGHQFCADKALLMSYLYGECDEVERRDVEQHLVNCPACSAEIDQLRALRVSLSDWKVPDRTPGVQIQVATVAEHVSEQPVSRSWTPPWWLQAAAAVLLLAASAGLARVEVQYGPNGFVVRTGWRTSATAAPATSVQAPTPGEEPWRIELATLERDLRNELRTVRPAAVPAPTASQNVGAEGADAGARGLNEATLLRRVQALIEQSEERQRREVAERLSGIITEVEMQRRADLRGVQQRFGQLEGQTGIVVRQNQEMVNYLRRVSQQP
jgi:anti-sigma factor RsiW